VLADHAERVEEQLRARVSWGPPASSTRDREHNDVVVLGERNRDG